MPLIGAVSLMMTFVDRVTKRRRTVPAKFKILAASRTDWVPIILGGMSIDCVDRGGLGLVTQKMGFYLSALDVCVDRLDKYTQGRPDKSVYALRSEIVRSAVDSDDSDEDQPKETAAGIATSLKTVRPVERSVLGMTASLAETLAEEYDRVELDELILDTVGVVIPTGGGAWLPVIRKEVRTKPLEPTYDSGLGTRFRVAPESPDLLEELPPEPEDAGARAPVGCSEVVLPLYRRTRGHSRAVGDRRPRRNGLRR